MNLLYFLAIANIVESILVPFNLPSWEIYNNYTSSWMKSVRNKGNIVMNSTGLHILTLKHNGSKPYSTGYIKSKQKFGYGYYQAKYKYASATGINNAFWLTTDRYMFNGQSRFDEIDINEGKFVQNDIGKISMTIHQWLPNLNSISTSSSLTRNNTFFARDFHRFGFLYTPKVLQWYYNGNVIKTFNNTNPKTSVTSQKVSILFSTVVAPFAGKVSDKVIGTDMNVAWVSFTPWKPI